MLQKPRDKLTPAEIAVLKVAWYDRATNDEIARALGLSPETVKTHLRNVRIKTGLTKLAAARSIFGDETHHIEGSPPLGRAGDRPVRQVDQAVQEERLVFEAEPSPVVTEWPHQRTRPPNELTAWQKVMVMLVGAILLMTLLSQAVPVSQLFQRFADLIDPPS